MRSRTGSGNGSFSATGRVSFRGAPDPRSCDIDHVVPHDHEADAEGRPQPGPTATSNLAALCRHHHRLKTHTAWRYTVVGPGEFEWTSPHGHRFHRDPSGTTAIEPPEPPEPPERR